MEAIARRLITRLWAQWDSRSFWSATRAVRFMHYIRMELRSEPGDPDIIRLFREVTRR